MTGIQLGLGAQDRKIGTLIIVRDGKNPTFILLHCGANGIGRFPVYAMFKLIDQVIKRLKALFHSPVIIWSQLLPRLHWRYSINIVAMEKRQKG